MNPTRPEHEIGQVPANDIELVLAQYKITEDVAVVGMRGWVQQFKDSAAGRNLTNVYDDAIVVAIRRAGVLRTTTFVGNTDPTRNVVGRAVLCAGQKVRYVRGEHGVTTGHPRQAWIQASGVTIQRYQADGTLGPVEKNVWGGFNIHDDAGSHTTTASEGCQTLPLDVWPTFDSLLEQALRAAAQHQFWYVLR